MNPQQMSTWRDRLAHSHEVWRDQGLDEDSTNANSVMSYFRAYRGDMWSGQGLSGWGGLNDHELVVDPIYFEAINTLMASLYARNPRLDVIAENPGSLKGAQIMERLTNHVLRKRNLKIKRNVNDALLDAVLCPFGVVRHGFTPSIEKRTDNGELLELYDPAKPDFPWIRRWAPWHVRFDPLAERFDPNGSCRWAAFRSFHTMDAIKQTPGLIARRDLTPTRSLRDVAFRDASRTSLPPAAEDAEVVELWTVYDKVRRTWFAISDGSESLLREEKPWPIQWDSLPYNILMFNEQADSPFGISYASKVLPIAIEVNKMMTLSTVAAKSTRRMIGVLKGAINDENERKKLVNDPGLHEFFFLDGGKMSDVVQQITVGGMDQQLVLFAEILRQRVRSAIGVSEMDRANRINVDTATEASAVSAGSSLQRGRNLGPFEDFLSDTLATFGEALQNTVTERFAVPIVGHEDATTVFAGAQGSPFLQAEPEEIQGEFVYTVRPGSTAPRNPLQDFTEEVVLTKELASVEAFQNIVDWPQRLVSLLRAFGKVPQDEIADQEMQQGTEQVLQGQGLTNAAPGAPGQNRPSGGGVDGNVAQLLAARGGQGGG